MSINWKQRYAENPHLDNEALWQVDISSLPVRKRKTTQRNQNICYDMRHGGVGRIVAENYGVTPQQVTYVMQRVFSVDENGEFFLSRGLITGDRLKKPKRNAPLSTKAKPTNAKCCLGAVCEALPDWLNELFQLVLADERRDPYALNLTPQCFWQLALAGLKARDWPLDTWPFSHDTKGYSTFRRLLIKLRNQIAKERSNLRKTLEGIHRKDLATMPFDEVQIDWQVCDEICRLTTECEGDVVDTRLERCCLLVAFCVKTRCVLAWHLALTRNPNHADILQVIDNIFRQRKRTIRVTPELEHFPGADYPVSVIPEMHMIGINTISMDNAWANMARAVCDKACDIGALIRFGKGNTPLDRNFVESVFYYINGLTHRQANTTGSHPNDPIKEAPKNAKKPPVVSIQSFQELLDVWISKYNADISFHNMAESPLQRLEQYYRTQPIRLSHNFRHQKRDLFISEHRAKIYAPKKELRRPEIHHQKLVYRGSDLTDRDLAGTEVKFRRDRRDIRSIEVFTLKGQYLGKLHVQRAYLEYPLSETTYLRVKAFVKKYGTKSQNPVIAYLRHHFLNRESTRSQLEFLRVSEELKGQKTLFLNDADEATQEKETEFVERRVTNVPSIRELMKQKNYGEDLCY